MARDVLVDRLKGYACFLVVLGHVLRGMRNAGIGVPGFAYGFETFIWSFHVALFLFLSGFVYTMTKGWKNKGTKAKFILYKLINLGVPYTVFSVIYILINSFVSSTNAQSSAADILTVWKTPVAQYWFLYALFFLLCIWTLLSGIMENWQITLAAVGCGYLLPLFGIGFGGFEFIVYSALAFGLGTFLKVESVKKCGIVVKIPVILCHMLLGALLVRLNLLDRIFIKEFMMVLGIYASIMLISEAEKLAYVSKFLDFMGKYSFQIYLLHTIFTAGVRILLIRLGITNWVIHLLCGCILGIGASYISAKAACRIKVFNICFFPTKTLSEIKKRKNRI